jgi:low molecular weight protein-tyrosine phosphatase
LSVFTVLHVCMGNICRSPMAERLLIEALRAHVNDQVDELYRSHGAGTGTWHIGEPMNAPAAAELRRRGGDPSGFVARHLIAELIDESDLVLCATGEHASRVLRLRPEARSRTFVLGEVARLLPLVTLPAEASPRDPATAHARGVAVVAALDTVRAGAPPRPTDDLDDPYGMGARAFMRAADEIDAAVVPLAAALAAAH